ADLDLKALALMALHLGWSQQPGVQAFLEAEVATRGDRRDAILRLWSIAADHLGENFAAKGDLTNAIICFTKSLEAQPDNY
ncbi:hypothetical protein, partial [Streptococcus pneumoniae]|uniref:hypothetical protein n=1 Tax=Streptococcus pneumoniae TaxID=1313 RepID=UPI0018B0959A